MSFHLLSANQKFAELSKCLVITNDGLKLLKSSVKDDWDILGPPEREKWTEAFRLLDALAPVTAFLSWKANDQHGLKQWTHVGYECFGYDYTDGRGMVTINGWMTKSKKYDDFPQDMSKWGWDETEALAPYTDMIGQWITQNNLKITFNEDLCKKAKALRQKKRKNEFTQVLYDATESLAEVSACVVFLGSGYLDDKGDSSPLAGARLFESSGAAYTTIRSRKLKNAVVVNVKTSITTLDPQSVEKNKFSNLNDALATQQNKRMKDALDLLSRDQLMARLTELEQKLGEHNTPPEPAVRKSKM